MGGCASIIVQRLLDSHDDVIKWKHFTCYWPFVRGSHWSPVSSPHKGQWRGALMISLICTHCWENNGEVGDLRRHRAHYDVIVMRNAICRLKWECSCIHGLKVGSWSFACTHWLNVRIVRLFLFRLLLMQILCEIKHYSIDLVWFPWQFVDLFGGRFCRFNDKEIVLFIKYPRAECWIQV